MKKIYILLNPSSGGGRPLKNKNQIESELARHNLDFKIQITKSEEHLRALVTELAPRALALVAAGGDSTLTIIAHEMIENKIDLPIGILPLGSSDDIALEWGIPRLKEAVAALTRKPLPIDIGSIYDLAPPQGTSRRLIHHFIGQCNAGIGVEVNRKVGQVFKKYPWLRPFQALVGLYSIFFSFNERKVPINMTIKWTHKNKTKQLTSPLVSALFGKIRYWAGGKLYLPRALPDDKNLQMALVKKASLWRTLAITLKSQNAGHIEMPEVEAACAKAFELSGEKPFFLQIDGDIYPQEFSHVEIKVSPGSLRAFRNPG